MQVKTRAARARRRGPASPITGELGRAAPRRCPTRSWPRTAADFGGDDRSPTRSTTTTTASARPTGTEDHRAAAVGRQLGRPGPAPARQLRGLRARGVERRSGSRCTASSTGRTSTRTTGVSLQKRFFDHFLKGEDNGWDEQPRVQLQVRHVATGSSSAPRRSGRSRAREWTRFYLDPAGEALSRRAARRRPSVELRGARRRRDVLDAPAGARRSRSPGPLAAKLFVSSSTADADLFLVAAGVRPGRRGGRLPGRDRPAHADRARAGCAHRTASSTRAQRRPYRPYHTHDELQPLDAGRGLRARHRDLADLHRRARRLPDRAHRARPRLRVRRRRAGDAALHFKNELRGCGPFLHDDPGDRPTDVFGGKVTIHTGGEHRSYLLLPFVPEPS